MWQLKRERNWKVKDLEHNIWRVISSLSSDTTQISVVKVLLNQKYSTINNQACSHFRSFPFDLILNTDLSKCCPHFRGFHTQKGEVDQLRGSKNTEAAEPMTDG